MKIAILIHKFKFEITTIYILDILDIHRFLCLSMYLYPVSESFKIYDGLKCMFLILKLLVFKEDLLIYFIALSVFSLFY